MKDIAPVIVAIITPLLAWVLSYFGAQRRANEMNAIQQKVTILQSILCAEKEQLPDAVRQQATNELKRALEQLAQIPIGTANWVYLNTESLNLVERIFLVHRLPNVASAVYRVAFYLMVAAIFSGVGFLIEAAYIDIPGNQVGLFILDMVAYTGLAVLFRHLALSEFTRYQDNSKMPDN